MRFAEGKKDFKDWGHTDSNRKKMYLDGLPTACSWYGFDSVEIARWFHKEATEKDLKKKTGCSFYDVARAFLLRQGRGEHPFMADMRRGQIEAAMAYTNGGGSLYNMLSLFTIHTDGANPELKKQIEKQNEADLEAFIAEDPKAMARFASEGRVRSPLYNLAGRFYDPREFLKGRHVNIREFMLSFEEANDLLYIYKMLMEHRPEKELLSKSMAELKAMGIPAHKLEEIQEHQIAQAALEGELAVRKKSSNPEVRKTAERIEKSLVQMEKLARIPENERFSVLNEMHNLVMKNPEMMQGWSAHPSKEGRAHQDALLKQWEDLSVKAAQEYEAEKSHPKAAKKAVSRNSGWFQRFRQPRE